MELIVIGVNHRSSPVDLREKLAMDKPSALQFIKDLGEAGVASEGILVSTCNRVELYAITNDAAKAMEAIPNHLAAVKQLAASELYPFLLKQQGNQAVEHLFKVTASLESLVVGEPQILGQVKEAYANSQEGGVTGPSLNRLLHKAFHVAKRVRSETQISRLAMSVSSVAVDLSKKIFERLDQQKVMLVGAGEMAELAARHFSTHGIRELFVLNRTYERAVTLAQEFGAVAAPFEKLHHFLGEVDIALFSAGAPHHLVKASDLAGIMKQRKQRPLFLIDIAVPRNIDPAVGDLDNVYLYDVDDLQQIVDENRSLRTGEADSAHAIVQEETESYLAWTHAQKIFPVIARLTARADAIRRAEVERTLADLGLEDSPKAAEKLDRMTHAIVSKLLHNPIQAIKDAQSEGDTQALETVRRMFALDDETNTPAQSGPDQRKKA